MKNIKMSDLFRPSWLLLHRNRKPGIDCICAEGTRMTRVTPSDNVTDCVKHFCSQHSVSFFWTLKLWKHSQRYGTRCSGTLNSFLYGFLCGSCPKNWWLFSLKYCLHFKKKLDLRHVNTLNKHQMLRVSILLTVVTGGLKWSFLKECSCVTAALCDCVGWHSQAQKDFGFWTWPLYGLKSDLISV